MSNKSTSRPAELPGYIWWNEFTPRDRAEYWKEYGRNGPEAADRVRQSVAQKLDDQAHGSDHDAKFVIKDGDFKGGVHKQTSPKSKKPETKSSSSRDGGPAHEGKGPPPPGAGSASEATPCAKARDVDIPDFHEIYAEAWERGIANEEAYVSAVAQGPMMEPDEIPAMPVCKTDLPSGPKDAVVDWAFAYKGR